MKRRTKNLADELLRRNPFTLRFRRPGESPKNDSWVGSYPTLDGALGDARRLLAVREPETIALVYQRGPRQRLRDATTELPVEGKQVFAGRPDSS